jgi:hypothetical protein
MFDAITGPFNDELGDDAPTTTSLTFVEESLHLIFQIICDLNRRRRGLEPLALMEALQ